MNLQIIATIIAVVVGGGAITGGGYHMADRFFAVERIAQSLSIRAAEIDLANLEQLRNRRPLSRVEKRLYCQYGRQLGYWGSDRPERCPFAAVRRLGKQKPGRRR